MQISQEMASQARLELDATGMAGGTCGLDILDPEHEHSVQLGLRSDSRLCWRAVTGQSLCAWEPLGIQLQGIRATLCLRYDSGRVQAFIDDEPQTLYPLGAGFGQSPPDHPSLGIFGAEEPGREWTRLDAHRRAPAGTPRLADRLCSWHEAIGRRVLNPHSGAPPATHRDS